MKYFGVSLALLVLLFASFIGSTNHQYVFEKSETEYLESFGYLHPRWSSETLYQTKPLGPISICETSANEVLVLDKAGKEVVELHLNGSVSTYISIGNIILDAFAYQPKADRVIAIGGGAFYTINDTTIEVIKEHPSNTSFSTLVVNSTDDSIYTGHWMNNSKIYHFDADGQYISTIRTEVLGCTQLAIDTSENLLYYAETFSGRITRLNMTSNTTVTLTSGIAIPGTGEGIGIATDNFGTLFYYVAEGHEKGFHKYNGTHFEYVMEAKLGTGPITWSDKFNSFLGTPGFGACVIQCDPNETEPKRLTPTINTRSIIETSDGTILIGIEDDIYKIESGEFSEFVSELPFHCSNLVQDDDENIYASLTNDSVSILQLFPDGTNSTWFRKDMKTFPSAISYDSNNDLMILMTHDHESKSFDLWRLPIDNPYDYSKIATIENVTSGDFTVDKSGNIYVLERGENVLYKIPDESNQVQTLFTNVVEHAFLVYPHIAYSTEADAVILCRNDDLQAWPVNGSSSYILGVSAIGIDHEGLFENGNKDLVGTHSGQVFKLSYEDSTSTSTETSTTTLTTTTDTLTEIITLPTTATTPFNIPTQFPVEFIAIGVGVVVLVLMVICVKTRR